MSVVDLKDSYKTYRLTRDELLFALVTSGYTKLEIKDGIDSCVLYIRGNLTAAEAMSHLYAETGEVFLWE